MKFYIPKKYYIRWQAALAVLEDLQEDLSAPFDMTDWADSKTLWEKKNGCGTTACFAGYISVAPYCKALGYPKDDKQGRRAVDWLFGTDDNWPELSLLYEKIFHQNINKGSRSKTLAFLEKQLKSIFKESTGKTLVAPLTFYIAA